MTLPTLEDYLRKQNAANGAIDYRIRFCEVGGVLRFYIHAIDKDSQTVDFELRGNELKTLTATGTPTP